MQAQIKTLLLMAAVMAAIIVYAVIPTEITLGSYTIRKITLASLNKPLIEKTKQPKPTVKKLRRNQTILFIGDSMVEGSRPAKALIPPVTSADTLERGTPSMTKRGLPSLTP